MWLLQQAELELTYAKAIVVAKGPGSFNGLRAGVSTAKGLAFSLGIPLLGISNLEAEAYLFAFTGLPICAIHKAGPDQLFAAVYLQKNEEWQCLGESVTTLEALCHRISEKTLLCGEIPPEIANQIRQRLGNQVIITSTDTIVRLSSLTALGWRKLSQGIRDNPATLQPLYVRPPHITAPKTPYPEQVLTKPQDESPKVGS